MKGMWLARAFIAACSILFSTFLTHTPGYAQGTVDYSVSLSSSPSFGLLPGNPFIITVTVSADSMVSSFSGLVTDTITSDMTYVVNNVFWTYPISNCTQAANNIICSFTRGGSLPGANPIRNNGVPLQIPINFPPIQVVITPLAAGVITNTATVGGNMPDPNPGNNIASLITIVLQQGPGGLISIPTMRDWGMLILIVLLGITSLYFLRLRIREG